MDLGLADRVALVCGASRGLGYAAATALAREGARVVLCARERSTLDAAAAEIRRSTGAQVLALAADLTASREREYVVRLTTETFGPVDVLVTNGGGPPAGSFESHDIAAWNEAAAQVLLGVVALTRLVLPGMRARRWGRVVAISSIAAERPVRNLVLSNVLRAAVGGFVRSLAAEVAGDGVTVNAVLSGYMRTNRIDALARSAGEANDVDEHGVEATKQRWLREIPLGRFGEPTELAALVAMLASEQASYVTGASIPVDGGWLVGAYHE
ncbi:MAG: SDR family oxidoreductase [Gemmatimonadaceae bacterium]